MKTGKEDEVSKMLEDAKTFVAMFDNTLSILSQEDIDSYIDKLKKSDDQ